MLESNMPGKMIELIYHNVHDHGVAIGSLWTQEVEKLSNHRVHFTNYTAAGPAITEKADVVRDFPMAGGTYPLLDLIQTPMLIPNSIIGSRVVAQLYHDFPEFRNELNDVKLVGIGTGARMAIFSTKKWGPIHNLEQLKGARIRSLLPIDKAIEALGAIPLHIEYFKIRQLLESGELDATVLGFLPAKMFRLAEGVAPYCTVTGKLSITMHTMRLYMKKASWEKLSPDIQAIIDGLGPQGADCWFARQCGLDSDGHVKEALDYFNRYGEIFTVPDEEEDRWRKKMQPAIERSLDKVESVGLPARNFYDRVKQLVQDFSTEYNE